ncbi:photosystem II D1 precursor processing protein PSB27-H2, chloroplastic isoform X1 [Rhodamnia argentea]|uniref:Photosystem II D1 precursor processing protein PSB27-H2, chloroplastic isoform X1 n=1 Tax=Rhodamnia argentea TaxID=178133 RepID=A0A8B8PPA9_9MYRT|nr:photosystem II D1 precursor processing protein PSB27-H2, chloroplastic isoform X1 [Rhodamnia argentea]XP_030536055.1 photosystem II D1 precursor processing protein PSB27-H2, chloroplastic isoform X1 [Rhodamnia argentea]XP_030536057.1 photosystem II D1 precursor processing protein PSB27-H2, chloroplastic isoform X1 [Rhodamnia argentea]XP_030536058.1 photosystem II D1 precursor processing protein PSB27-H2, chloroplastic isoform X1 [Rhodamnia argentea]XP_048136893.1 photosystem II D1 precursor 
MLAVNFTLRMAIITAAAKFCPATISRGPEKISNFGYEYKLQSRYQVVLPLEGPTFSRRNAIICIGSLLASVVPVSYVIAPLPVLAEEKSASWEDEDGGVIGAIQSLFDPNEKTKSGKVLPKAYLKSAREVVKTLRESLKEDPKDIPKFRRTADSAKESIREYLSSWRGQSKVANEESYVMLEKAIRSLASFYSKAGPSAPLPEEIKSEILANLSKADEFL